MFILLSCMFTILSIMVQPCCGMGVSASFAYHKNTHTKQLNTRCNKKEESYNIHSYQGTIEYQKTKFGKRAKQLAQQNNTDHDTVVGTYGSTCCFDVLHYRRVNQ